MNATEEPQTSRKSEPARTGAARQRPLVRTGLDVAVGWLKGEDVSPEQRGAADLLRKGKLGLVTNPSAVARDLVAAPDALRAAGAKLASLFGPEHGVRGEIADGVKVPQGKDARTGIPLWSLYGAAFEPTAEMVAGLDALVFDIQDVGSRFYTFSSTLSYVIAAGRKNNLPVIVLDRPNPLGGARTEGPLLDPKHASFVGLHPIPIRHGLTMGEFGRLCAHFGVGEPPLVVTVEGWSRGQRWPETGLQWIAPSPNMPTFETALVYPGMCLLEGTNVSEGRGTTTPFLSFGAAWIGASAQGGAPSPDAESLADALNGAKLAGVRFRPTRFRPTSSKFTGDTCAGCQLHITDADTIRPVATGVAVLSTLHRLYPGQFAWRENNGKFAVDRLAGSGAIREEITAGRAWQEIARSWEAGDEMHHDHLKVVKLYE